jgi:hypothetical protein
MLYVTIRSKEECRYLMRGNVYLVRLKSGRDNIYRGSALAYRMIAVEAFSHAEDLPSEEESRFPPRCVIALIPYLIMMRAE